MSQPLPEYVMTLQNQIENLNTMITGLRKGTDKKIGQVRGDIKRILELKDKGLDESAISRELFIDQLIQGQSAGAQQPNGTGTQSAGLDMGSIDTALELPANDPRVTNLKLKYGGDPAAYLREGLKLKIQLSQNPPLTPAENPLPPGRVPSADAAAQIEKGYLEEIAKVPRGNIRMANQVKTKWRAKAREAGLSLNV